MGSGSFREEVAAQGQPRRDPCTPPLALRPLWAPIPGEKQEGESLPILKLGPSPLAVTPGQAGVARVGIAVAAALARGSGPRRKHANSPLPRNGVSP